jgi:hypothetical protein
MTWSDFYLICFVVGFGLSALALLGGSVHFHLPHVHMHGGGPHAGGHGAFARGGQPGGLSWFNFGTIASFLAWFGGTGFLLEWHYHVSGLIALGVAVLSGVGASALVFWFLVLLMANETALNAADYGMVGVLGKLSIPIREGGTGELIYSQQGTRRVAGARSEAGIAIAKGRSAFVVVPTGRWSGGWTSGQCLGHHKATEAHTERRYL